MLTSLLTIALVLGGAQAGTQARDARAIAAAKAASVHRLERALPDKPFAKWLRGVVGPQVQISWEVNDCGEQTGNPEVDKGRDFPMCVEAQAGLRGKRTLSISLSVGTFKTGVKAGSIRLAYAVLVLPDGPAKSIGKLSQVPEAIRTGPQARQK